MMNTNNNNDETTSSSSSSSSSSSGDDEAAATTTTTPLRLPGASRIVGFEANPSINDDIQNTTNEENEFLPIASLVVIDHESQRPSLISELSSWFSFRRQNSSDYNNNNNNNDNVTAASSRWFFERIPSENIVSSSETEFYYHDDTTNSNKKSSKRKQHQTLKSKRLWLSFIVSLLIISLVLLPVFIAFVVVNIKAIKNDGGSNNSNNNDNNNNHKNGTDSSNPNNGDSIGNALLHPNKTKDDDEADNGIYYDGTLDNNNNNNNNNNNFGVKDGVEEENSGGEEKSPPNDQRFHSLLNILKQVTSMELLTDETTPQYQALQWMLDYDSSDDNSNNNNNKDDNNDIAIGIISNELTTQQRLEIVQRYVLTVLYFATDGPSSWVNANDFLIPSQSVCKWGSDVMSIMAYSPEGREDQQQQSGSSVPSFAKVLCKANKVTSVLIENNGLRGTLPDELFLLTDLENLTLIRNPQLMGTIPQGIGNLVQLEALHLYKNTLTGQIPPTIGLLKDNLRHLDVARNRLMGNLPVEIGYLETLQELYLEHNWFQGSLPESMKNMNQLEVLSLHGNDFTGDVSSLYCPLPRDDMELIADCDLVDCNCCTTCCNRNDDPDGIKSSQNAECYM